MQRINFNQDWRFQLENEQDTYNHFGLHKYSDAMGAAARFYEHSNWQHVDLPHDWAVALPKDPQADNFAGSRNKSAYNRFTTEDADYTKWAQFILRNISDKAIKGVDLACGTGKMTRILASNRLDVTGMDCSQEMLAQATAQGGKCRYVCQSLQDFQTPSFVDFVTIVNDGVNYLSPSEVPSFFGKVHNALKRGGTFIFDVSTEYKLTQVVANNVFFVDDEDVTCLWNNTLENGKVQMDLTFFVKDGTLYNRYDETHVQYVHPTQQLTTQLQQAGFEVKLYDCYTPSPAVDTTQRVTFVATKK